MRPEEIEKAIKDAEAEFAKEKRELIIQLDGLAEYYERVLAGLHWLKEHHNGTAESTGDTAIEKVVDNLKGRFTRKELEEALKESGAVVPTRWAILKDLEQRVAQRKLRIAVKGRGRRATVYTKVEAKE